MATTNITIKEERTGRIGITIGASYNSLSRLSAACLANKIKEVLKRKKDE